jgi:ribonuclease HII
MPNDSAVALHTCFSPGNKWEIGVDEAGRGPLFGRLYVAGTILPKDTGSTGFRHDWMKDSKRFSSAKKIRQVSDYIKANAIAWTIQYVEPDVIDAINIRQAVLSAMRLCVKDLLFKIREMDGDTDITKDVCLLIDGNDFPAYTLYDDSTDTISQVRHETVEGGDNLYTCIAAASILAKVARDDYIDALCVTTPELVDKYGIDKNKGYGTKHHLDGIREHGVTDLHRKSYRPCKAIPI